MAPKNLEASVTASQYQMLANAVVTRGAVSFRAFVDVQDERVFERHAMASDEVLRYRLVDAPDIAPSEQLKVDGVDYRVQGDPHRLNAYEASAQIVRVG